MKVTLAEWQKILKPRSSIIFNASEFEKQTDCWVPFTIGVSYKYIWTNDIPELQIGTHTETVLCAFREETDAVRRPSPSKNRRSIAKTLQQNGIKNTFVDGVQFFYDLPKYKFVISPEGNGVDCHRHYEAILAGCIPIIEDHVGIREKYEGCPVLYTNDYSEITHEYLLQKYTEMIDQEYDFSKLFMQSYSPEIQAQIRENGNYWGKRLTGRVWY